MRKWPIRKGNGPILEPYRACAKALWPLMREGVTKLDVWKQLAVLDRSGARRDMWHDLLEREASLKREEQGRAARWAMQRLKAKEKTVDAVLTARAALRIQLMPYCSADAGTTWADWREHFLLVAHVRQWGPVRQCHEIAAATWKEDLTEDLDYDHGDPIELLDDLQKRFCPSYSVRWGQYPRRALQSQLDFEEACQRPGEVLRMWHERCRELFIKAFPYNNSEKDPAILEQFLCRIHDPDLVQMLAQQPFPKSYAGALGLARLMEQDLQLRRGEPDNPFTKAALAKAKEKEAYTRRTLCNIITKEAAAGNASRDNKGVNQKKKQAPMKKK